MSQGWSEINKDQKIEIDQKKLDKYYTSVLAKLANADTKKELEEYSKKHKISHRTIWDIKSWKAFFSIFKNQKLVAQREINFFLKWVEFNPKV